MTDTTSPSITTMTKADALSLIQAQEVGRLGSCRPDAERGTGGGRRPRPRRRGQGGRRRPRRPQAVTVLLVDVHFAVRAVQRGADGLVLFNRFYQPDVDVDTFDIVPRIDLSSSWELRLPLRWTAILRPVLHRPISLAVTSGVDTGRDVAKALLVGADVVMTTSSLLRHGPDHIRVLEADLVAWMAGHGFDSVDQLRGSMSVATAASPAAFERANYVRTLHSWGTPAGTPAR